MIQILADTLKERSLPPVPTERFIAVAVKRIAVRLARVAVDRCGSTVAVPASWIAAKAPVIASTEGSPILSGRISIAPAQIERVGFGSVVGVFDSNHRGSAVTRIANQILPPAPIDAGKMEFARIGRHGGSAFEAAPLGLLSGEIPQHAAVAANFHFRGSIDNHFYRALAAIGTTSAHHGRTSRKGLGASNSCHRHQPEENTLIHVYHPGLCEARCQPFHETICFGPALNDLACG